VPLDNLAGPAHFWEVPVLLWRYWRARASGRLVYKVLSRPADGIGLESASVGPPSGLYLRYGRTGWTRPPEVAYNLGYGICCFRDRARAMLFAVEYDVSRPPGARPRLEIWVAEAGRTWEPAVGKMGEADLPLMQERGAAPGGRETWPPGTLMAGGLRLLWRIDERAK